ncbi:MAG: 2-haloacid dehalogenase [Thermomicrobiales bacterium]|jgi:2-haloacid dehalogenase|nr:2-haloacid dehalogenase [Thermomicrobiales bacterium]
MSALSDVRAVLFDAYGTLFRFDSIEEACATALGAAGGSGPTPTELATLWRSKQLEYSVHRSLMGNGHYVDFAAVTVEALDYSLARFGVELPGAARSRLLRAWQTPRADSDTLHVLAALSPLPRAILSNGSPAMLQAAIAAAGLSPQLDAILSADEVRIYKPHPRVYALGTARFGCEPKEIAFVTGNGWDAAGAAAFGYRVCWVNRTGLPAERHGPPPAAIVESLAGIPAALGR